MSRIGRLPVVVPPKWKCKIDGTLIKVKGPKGSSGIYISPGYFVYAGEWCDQRQTLLR